MDIAQYAWQVWVFAGVALALLEIPMPGFVVLWLGVGALLAAIPAALGLPAWTQFAVFGVSSLALFGASRTVFKRFLMRDAARVRTGVDAMIGAEASVIELVSEGGGTVRINGELWHARSLTGQIPAGAVAVVDRVEGLKLYVRQPGVALAARKEKDA